MDVSLFIGTQLNRSLRVFQKSQHQLVSVSRFHLDGKVQPAEDLQHAHRILSQRVRAGFHLINSSRFLDLYRASLLPVRTALKTCTSTWCCGATPATSWSRSASGTWDVSRHSWASSSLAGCAAKEIEWLGSRTLFRLWRNFTRISCGRSPLFLWEASVRRWRTDAADQVRVSFRFLNWKKKKCILSIFHLSFHVFDVKCWAHSCWSHSLQTASWTATWTQRPLWQFLWTTPGPTAWDKGPKTRTRLHPPTPTKTLHRRTTPSCRWSLTKVMILEPLNYSQALCLYSAFMFFCSRPQWRSTASVQPQTWQRPAPWWTATGWWWTRTPPLWVWVRPSWSTSPWSWPTRGRISLRCSSGEDVCSNFQGFA